MERRDKLTGSQTRDIYDRHGEEGLRQHEARKQGGGSNPNDIFARFFGGGGAPQEKRGPGMVLTLEVELADMYNGRTAEVRPSSSRVDPSLTLMMHAARLPEKDYLHTLSRIWRSLRI